MYNGQFDWIAGSVRNTADDALRDAYVRGMRRDVVPPMTVIRRPDALLESTKQAGLKPNVQPDMAGCTNKHAATNSSTIRPFPLPLPLIEEQGAILDSIAIEMLETDLLRDCAERGIASIREYRARQITGAVTGKADVRQACELAPALTDTVDKPVRRKRAANVHFRRAVFAAEIVRRPYKEPTFGQVKFEKFIFLCEKRCGVDAGSTSPRQVACSHDNRVLRSFDSQLKRHQWHEIRKGDKGHRCVPLAQTVGHREYLGRYFDKLAPQLNQTIDLFRTAQTDQCEIIAALHAARGDVPASGGDATDKQVVKQALRHGHPSKWKIAERRWCRVIDRMREEGLTPELWGRHADD